MRAQVKLLMANQKKRPSKAADIIPDDQEELAAKVRQIARGAAISVYPWIKGENFSLLTTRPNVIVNDIHRRVNDATYNKHARIAQVFDLLAEEPTVHAVLGNARWISASVRKIFSLCCLF